MDTLMWNVAEGIARHFLTYGAGALVTGGYLSNSEATQVVGAVMGLLAIGWSAYSKRQAETRVAVAYATPVPEPIILQPGDPRNNTPALNQAEVQRHV